MKQSELNKQNQAVSNQSNIIFGTSSDDIQQGLNNGQFVDEPPGDKDQILNEQEQNEIVNRAEESFNEGLSPEASGQDKELSTEKPELLPEAHANTYDDGPKEVTGDGISKETKIDD